MWPVLFRIPLPFGGSLPIRSFGVMVVLGFLLGSALLMREGRRRGFDERFLSTLTFMVLIGVLVGGRLGYVIVHLDRYLAAPLEIVRIDRGGLVMYGGLFAIIVIVWFLCRRHGVDWRRLADLAVPWCSLGLAIGRIGCLLVGDDYGRPAPPGFPFAIRFPTETSTGDFFGITVPRNGENLCGYAGQWIYPTQTLLMLKSLVLFAFLRVFAKRWKRYDGQILHVYLLGYAILRFLIEFLRGDDRERGFVGFLSTSQFVGIFLAAFAIASLVRGLRRARAAAA